MSEEQQNRQSFFSRMFAPAPEDDQTTVFSEDDVNFDEEEDTQESPQVNSRGFTVERAADIIRDLPPEVPRRSAVRIVRQTLIAAGISVEDLGRSTRSRESKLNSEMELREGRIEELKGKTDEVIKSYEEEIRKAREARDYGVSEEERKISSAREGLVDVERVRDFFDLPRGESRSTQFGGQDDEDTREEQSGTNSGDDTQVIERSDNDDTQILRPRGPLSEGWDTRRDSEND